MPMRLAPRSSRPRSGVPPQRSQPRASISSTPTYHRSSLALLLRRLHSPRSTRAYLHARACEDRHQRRPALRKANVDLRCQGRSKTHPFAPVENSPPSSDLVWGRRAGVSRAGLGPGGRESAVSGACRARSRSERAAWRRSGGFAEVAEGDRSGRFGGSGGGWAGEVAVFEAVAVAFEREDLGVVDEPVDHRGGDDVVAEDLPPGAERLVGRDDQRRALVAAADEHEHQVRGLGIERDVADLVDDQQRDPLQSGELVIEAAVALRVGEHGDPFGGGAERDAVSGEAGADADRDRQMTFPGPRRAEQDEILAAGEEVELAEMQDLVAADRGLEGEVELLERLAGGEARGLDAALAAVAVAAVDLGLEQRRGELLKAPLVGAGALGELRQRPRGRRRLHRAEQVRQL